MRRGILGLLVLVLACVGAPAGAAPSGQVVGRNGVLYNDDCHEYLFSYQVVVPPDGTFDWSLSVRLHGPKGALVDTTRVPKPGATGTSTLTVCPPPANNYGTYTISATFESQATEGGPSESEAFADAHFTLRKPRSRTALTASTRRPAYGQRVTYRIRAYDENPTGYLPRAFAWVHLETRRDGHWVRIRGSRAMTHENGAVKVRVRYLKHHERMKVRAVTERTIKFERSYSSVLRLW
jgi:hypothetical protein